jgi:Caspase domain
MKLLRFVAFLLLPVAVAAQPSSSSGASHRRGVALLVGNINYPEDPLDSVHEDLAGMRPALEALGFETGIVTNLDHPEDFRAAVDQFLHAKKADANDIVLVLYSGHGMQLDGSTYLLGTNYHTVTEPQAAAFAHAYSADELVKQLEQAPPYARIVIIDACRINAFTNQGQRGGVALRQNYDNTIVLFSNEPGKTVPARAATTLRSPFIEALIYALTTTTHGIKEIFETARRATTELSPGQVPQLLTSLNYDESLLSVQTPRAPSNRAAELVNQAKALYSDRSWKQYLEVFQTARAITGDPSLIARIDQETNWVNQVEQAETEADKNSCAEEGAHWDRASDIFPARTWTLERSALSKLKCDQVEAAIPQLVRLTLVGDQSAAARARLMLESLEKSDPRVNELAKRVPSDVPASLGSEFELIEIHK